MLMNAKNDSEVEDNRKCCSQVFRWLLDTHLTTMKHRSSNEPHREDGA